jgi:hypothetical protein
MRRMMDAHVESIRAVERALFGAGKVGATCKPGAVELGPEFDTRQPGNFAKLVKLHIDVMVTAIACEVTRAGVLLAGSEHNETVTFPRVGVNKTHHRGIQHKGSGANWTAVTRWFVEQFAYLMKAMQAIPTPGGDLLSDSVLLLCNNMGSGHSVYDLGYVRGGNAAGRIKGNRLISMATGSTEQKTKQLARSQILLSICHAMGLSDLTHFGRPGAELCPGPVPGLVA